MHRGKPHPLGLKDEQLEVFRIGGFLRGDSLFLKLFATAGELEKLAKTMQPKTTKVPEPKKNRWRGKNNRGETNGEKRESSLAV